MILILLCCRVCDSYPQVSWSTIYQTIKLEGRFPKALPQENKGDKRWASFKFIRWHIASELNFCAENNKNSKTFKSDSLYVPGGVIRCKYC